MRLDRFPLQGVREDQDFPLERAVWPATLAPIRQILDGGIDLGLSPEGGSSGARHTTQASESALSFSGCLSLLRTLNALIQTGESQVILSTHSPILAALLGAQIYEVGPWGFRPRLWDELKLVTQWKAFLDAPGDYLRHPESENPETR